MTTLVARMTPEGVGGVAAIAVVGTEAWSVVRPLFVDAKRQLLSTAPVPGELCFGYYGETPGDAVLLAVKSEVRLELHCHGGIQVTAWILEQLAAAGATVVPWTALESPAASVVANALTIRTAGIALDQYLGVKPSPDQQAEYERRRIIGQHLTTPFAVAVCGPPNVGKSSLINAIVGFQRAVVSATAGTTRDAVRTLTALDGWPVEFIDTAGVRETNDPLERAGIERSLETAATADFSIWVVDRSAGWVDPPPGFSPHLILANKSDLRADWQHHSTVPMLEVSALTGVGLEKLPSLLFRELPIMEPGMAVPLE